MGAITDVTGIRVGHVQKTDAGWLSGVTVVLPPPGTVGSVDVRGGGPGTHETDALEPTTLTSTVDAVVLTGGSAFGLAAAHGAQQWCEEHGRGFAVPGGVVPIVPAAAIFDLGRGGDFAARPDAAMGYAAPPRPPPRKRGTTSDAATSAPAPERQSAAGPSKGEWAPPPSHWPWRHRRRYRRRERARAAFRDRLGGETPDAPDTEFRPGLNTTLVVVATNAVLDKAECKRTAAAAHAGLARALDPSHTLADGDTVFALATGAVTLDRSTESARQRSLITLQSAAADVVRLAILDGVGQAEAVTTPAVHLAAYPG